MVDDIIIMAGGSGTRLWPASIKAMPKQFLDVTGGGSLLRQTIERAVSTGVAGEIIIVTLADQVEGIEKDLRTAPDAIRNVTVLPEPTARNTAPAITYAIQYLVANGRTDGTTLVLAADHVVTPTDAFVADVEKADQLAREGFLVTFGILPTRPETGYGYVQVGEIHSAGYRVQAFREKPDAQTAETYLSSGRHYWNSGMFVFPNRFFLEQLGEFEPTVAVGFSSVSQSLRAAAASVGSGASGATPAAGKGGPRVIPAGEELLSMYAELPKISVDYAVMERSPRCAMVPASFQWNDVGSWDEVAKLRSADAGSDTAQESPVISVDAEDNFVHSDLPVALCGVDGLHVVVKNGMVLICKRGESQKVKDVVTELKNRGADELL